MQESKATPRVTPKPRPKPKPRPQPFKPSKGLAINLGGQIWSVVEVKSRGRWKAAFIGTDPKFKPVIGMGLDFHEPGPVLQEIYQAKNRAFWAKPARIPPRRVVPQTKGEQPKEKT